MPQYILNILVTLQKKANELSFGAVYYAVQSGSYF